MAKVDYRLYNGKVVQIEVEDSVGEVCIEIRHEEQREKWRNKKREDASFDFLQSLGVEFADRTVDIEEECFKKFETEALLKGVQQLPPRQQELIDMVYFKWLSIAEIAIQDGTSESAIYARLATVHKKLKKLLEKSLNF